MSSGTSVSPHGFVAGRGRGYRPGPVDALAAELSGARDDARERAALLAAQVEELEAEAQRLRLAVTQLAPQTYESLGDRAREILALAEEEADGVRASAADSVRRITADAEADARETREAARAAADAVLAEAEQWADERLNADRATADGARAAARDEAKAWREEALAALDEARERTRATLAGQEKDHAERRDEAERELAGQEAAADARDAERLARAEGRLSEARRAFAETEESARHGQEDAEARAAELLAEATLHEEGVGRETERVLREHGEKWDEVRAHMDHVRTTLASLTGRNPADEAP
ncbi:MULTISPECIES: cellulose-binding protein [unclassified Streptomyces]|uniref:cellulose-binding protein n=1 Tax=unclassified Streptomyces TaxID=2593676 RepID=UPI002DDB0499|nr:cellulose-binding protein [Streptomyces sp. NBC_01445]WSE06749.1 cellulose-binding protein [Streptomyces sp. NBC_01445]